MLTPEKKVDMALVSGKRSSKFGSRTIASNENRPSPSPNNNPHGGIFPRGQLNGYLKILSKS